MRVIIIGGVAAGMSAAAKLKRLKPDYEVVIYEKTDVISFAEIDYDGEFGDDSYLGDIFINVDRVKSQARKYGHSEKREFCFLFVHGMLHLNGYDHMTKEEEKEMFDLQDKIIGDLR